MTKECIAMILAGGQGSRLGVLTKRLAKPAVPFGGKYRIIDFPLSNCYNSGIDTVGVLTQYQPFLLHSYIGIGTPWDLDRKNGGVFVLPPYAKAKGGEWYRGTAHAIYQNINFIDSYRPEHLLVLSGDHIYKMDYSLMLDFHKQQAAGATIAVIQVPWEEAGRFGIMNTDAGGRITEFEEKPRQPKNNLASMGIYIFNWRQLKRYLEEDAKDSRSQNDFGKNIIPAMLAAGEIMAAYSFDGYWKDVGTVESLWEANMDLLTDRPGLDLYDPAWRIYSVSPAQPPHFTASTAAVTNSLVSEGCSIYGTVEKSVLFPGVTVGQGAVIRDSVIFPNVRVGEQAVIEKSIVGSDTVIEAQCRIGIGASGQEITVIGEELVIPRDTEIRCCAMVEVASKEELA